MINNANTDVVFYIHKETILILYFIILVYYIWLIFLLYPFFLFWQKWVLMRISLLTNSGT